MNILNELATCAVESRYSGLRGLTGQSVLIPKSSNFTSDERSCCTLGRAETAVIITAVTVIFNLLLFFSSRFREVKAVHISLMPCKSSWSLDFVI